MKHPHFFLQALGRDLDTSSTNFESRLSDAESEVRPRSLRGVESLSGLPEYWWGAATVVFLSLLVLQAARWSIYLQSQYYFIKPMVVVVCWAVFIVVWRWRNRQLNVSPGPATPRDLFRVQSIGFVAGALVVLAAPVVEFINRQFQTGDPPEFLAFDAVLAVSMLLAVSHSRRLRQAALVSSAFTTLMVTFAKPDPAVYLFACVFGVVGLWRMMTTYWEGVESKAIGSVSRQLPFRFSILGLTSIIVLLLALLATGLAREALGWTSAWSFFSGGDQWSDPYATSGVGDGENLVAATKSAQSEGPIDSDMFIESKKRSLYDVITEMHGDKKPTPRTETTQAIGIHTENFIQNHGRVAKVEKNSSSFQTTRTGSAKPKPKPDDVLSDALLLVTGAAPTHLAMETFDLYDGETWFKTESDERRKFYGVMPGDNNEWYCYKRTDARSLFHSLHHYQVAFVHLQSPRIPTPPLLEAWSIGQINQSRFYQTTPDDGLEMPIGSDIPEFTLVRMIRRGFRLGDLPRKNFWAQIRSPRTATSLDPEGNPTPALASELEWPLGDEAVMQARDLAADWTRDSAPGWEKVERIVAGLRRDFQVQDVAETSLTQFLTERQGPDYMFATAAVLMLRSQGIPARFVSGFYVNPENFDAKTGKTAVVKQDTHFWAEVHVGENNWIPIEPTPGYAPTPESLTVADYLIQGLLAWVAWCLKNWGVALVGLLLLMGLVWIRHWIVDQLVWLRWRVGLWIWPQQAEVATFRLLERLAQRLGRPRPAHQPPATWLRTCFASSSPSLLNQFIESFHQHCYDTDAKDLRDSGPAIAVCRDFYREVRQQLKK